MTALVVAFGLAFGLWTYPRVMAATHPSVSSPPAAQPGVDPVVLAKLLRAPVVAPVNLVRARPERVLAKPKARKAAAVHPRVVHTVSAKGSAASPAKVAARQPVSHPVIAPAPDAAPDPAPAPTHAAALTANADSCAAAVAYLAINAAPGFTFECPGYALGHQAMTCINVAGACPGQKLIAINVVCPASYMNEASNSWVLTGLAVRPIDPYGSCP